MEYSEIKEFVNEYEAEKEQSLRELEDLHAKQREERGFDDAELWNLNATIARFTLPRLKAFRETHYGYPGDLKTGNTLGADKWNEILDDMIFAMEINADEEKFFGYDLDRKDMKKFTAEYKKRFNRVEKGLKLFAKWFGHLWD